MKSLLKLLSLACPALLAGCCCPQLSGRYCHGPQPLPAAGTECHPGLQPLAHPCGPHPLLLGDGLAHGPLLAWLHGSGERGGPTGPVPSAQHDDYVSPLAKFHPVPTRPVFEPLAEYHPAVLLDPGPH